MNFRSASRAAKTEIESRRTMMKRVLSFGVTALDEMTGGILPTEIVALGAPSGVGKTAFCCNMAIANISAGKKVHIFALEASEFEIERRMKYPLIADLYFRSEIKPKLKLDFNFRNWALGLLFDDMQEIENQAAEFFEKAYRDIFIFYKDQDFGSAEFISNVMSIAYRFCPHTRPASLRHLLLH